MFESANASLSIVAISIAGLTSSGRSHAVRGWWHEHRRDHNGETAAPEAGETTAQRLKEEAAATATEGAAATPSRRTTRYRLQLARVQIRDFTKGTPPVSLGYIDSS
jgi:hypothetical protein